MQLSELVRRRRTHAAEGSGVRKLCFQRRCYWSVIRINCWPSGALETPMFAYSAGLGVARSPGEGINRIRVNVPKGLLCRRPTLRTRGTTCSRRPPPRGVLDSATETHLPAKESGSCRRSLHILSPYSQPVDFRATVPSDADAALSGSYCSTIFRNSRSNVSPPRFACLRSSRVSLEQGTRVSLARDIAGSPMIRLVKPITVALNLDVNPYKVNNVGFPRLD